MPGIGDFEAIIDRLAWSWDHLQTFKIDVAATGMDYHWVPLPKVETQSGTYIDYVIDEATPLPGHLKFVLGDCIHSLRASLDNLVYALCPTDYAEFPVCKVSDQWPRAKGKIKAINESALTMLYDLQPFQPQSGGGTAERNKLWILDRLWNDDKHRAPHISFATTDEAHLDCPDGEIIWAIFNSDALELGTKICRVWITPNTEPELITQFALEITFDRFGPIRGSPVYPTLVDLHQFVREIVEDFRPFFI